MPAYQRYISKDFVIEGSNLRLDNKDLAWEQIDGRMRTEIRKAEKAGATIRKVKPTKEELAAFTEFCLNPDDLPPVFTERYHFYLAELEGKVIAGILLVEVGKKLFMLCHASTPVAKQNGIPSLLIWRMVEEFSGKQWTHLDVGASYRGTLQKYFTGFRTQEYPMIMKPPELTPDLRLTPFDTQAMDVSVRENAQAEAQKMLQQKFGKPFSFFPRAMYGVFTLIKWLKLSDQLKDGQNVWVTTTTDAHYVSSCVGSAIEQTAPVSRELNDKTGAIFVIHEFGFLHPKLNELRKIANERKIPLIEDCAYAWDTKGAGAVGDYAIYSLTKKFPVQFGGYVVGKEWTQEELWKDYQCSDVQKMAFAEERLAHWLPSTSENTKKRRANYAYYAEVFGAHRAVFMLSDGTDPGAFVLDMGTEEHMEEVSAFVRGFGIECGNYWKSHAIILPVHERLARAHLEYIAGSVLATEREWCGVPGRHP